MASNTKQAFIYSLALLCLHAIFVNAAVSLHPICIQFRFEEDERRGISPIILLLAVNFIYVFFFLNKSLLMRCRIRLDLFLSRIIKIVKYCFRSFRKREMSR